MVRVMADLKGQGDGQGDGQGEGQGEEVGEVLGEAWVSNRQHRYCALHAEHKRGT